MFRAVYDDQANTQPFFYKLGTDAEAYEQGEVLKYNAGVLTKADVDSTGSQEFIVIKDQAAETTAETLLPVIPLRGTQYYAAQAAGTVVVGNVYTLNATATGITTTTTNGVFKVTETDSDNNVVGYFVNAK